MDVGLFIHSRSKAPTALLEMIFNPVDSRYIVASAPGLDWARRLGSLRALAGEQVTQDRTNTEAERDPLIRMLVQSPVGDSRARHGFCLGPVECFPAPFCGARDPVAGVTDSGAGDVRRGAHQGPRIVGEPAQRFADFF
jgi:hypothetical protein